MGHRKDETVSLRYLVWQNLYETEKPFQVFSAIPPDAEEQRSTNLVIENAESEIIHDMRGFESQFTLDENAFMLRRQAMPDTNLSTEEEIRNEYIPSVEELLRSEVGGVDFIYLFDWGIRMNTPLGLDKINVNDKMQRLEPAKQVHCDQSSTGALKRLRHHCPDQMEKALKGRLRIINVWRPLEHAIEDNPLAVCDGSTVKESDLVEADHITRQYLGSTLYGLYSPRHRWYYMSQQTPEELLFLKIFDSDTNVIAHNCLHTSFFHQNIPAGAAPRISIEVRFLVVTYAADD